MSLQEIPAEIQSQIFSYLVASFGPSPIHSVLKTCRQLYQVALPLSVQVFRNAPPVSIGGGPCSKDSNAKFLHYILVSKPWLAKHVQTIILGRFSSSHDGDESDTPDNLLGDEIASPNNLRGAHSRAKITLNHVETRIRHHLSSLLSSRHRGQSSTISDMKTYQQYIRTILGPETLHNYKFECAQWLADLQRGTSDAQVALILLACPNIQSLYFEEPDKPRSFGFLMKLSQVLSSPPLSMLREIYSEGSSEDVGYQIGTSEILALLRLHSLRSCEFTVVGGNEDTVRMIAKLPPRSCQIEELTIRQAAAPRQMVYDLLLACRNLKSFEFLRGFFNGDVPSVLARDILDAVLLHAETLENLHINLWDDTHQQYQSLRRLYMGIKLRQMVALRSLVIGMQALTGMLCGPPSQGEGDVPLEIFGAPRLEQCLPESLEHLVITGCGKRILDQVTELLELIENGDRFRKLECIHLLFNIEHTIPKEVKLTPGRLRPRLIIVFQDRWRIFDCAITSFPEPGRKNRTLCSRIYAGDIREDWLNWRGGVTTRRWKAPEGFDNHFLYKEDDLYYMRNCQMGAPGWRGLTPRRCPRP